MDGEVPSNRGDYGERVGLTQNPISTLSISTFPILHALLRGLDYCLKIVYKLKGGVTAWKQNSKQKERVDAAKRKVQDYIKSKTGMVVDKPDPVGAGGTTTTGNIARNLLFDPVQRKVLVESTPEKTRRDGTCDRDVFGEFVTNLSVILKAVSSKKNINVEELDKLCK